MIDSGRTNLEREKYIRQEFLICYDKLMECLKHLANIRRMLPGTSLSKGLFANVLARQYWALIDLTVKLADAVEDCQFITITSQKGEG